MLSIVIGKNKNLLLMFQITIDELKKHLEAQFKIGMTWDNYGKDGWEIII